MARQTWPPSPRSPRPESPGDTQPSTVAEVGRIPETPPGVPTGLAWQRRGDRRQILTTGQRGIGGRAVQFAITVSRAPARKGSGGRLAGASNGVLGAGAPNGVLGTALSRQAAQRPNALAFLPGSGRRQPRGLSTRKRSPAEAGLPPQEGDGSHAMTSQNAPVTQR